MYFVKKKKLLEAKQVIFRMNFIVEVLEQCKFALLGFLDAHPVCQK